MIVLGAFLYYRENIVITTKLGGHNFEVVPCCAFLKTEPKINFSHHINNTFVKLVITTQEKKKKRKVVINEIIDTLLVLCCRFGHVQDSSRSFFLFFLSDCSMQ
jgi:hypothetical protein